LKQLSEQVRTTRRHVPFRAGGAAGIGALLIALLGELPSAAPLILAAAPIAAIGISVGLTGPIRDYDGAEQGLARQATISLSLLLLGTLALAGDLVRDHAPLAAATLAGGVVAAYYLARRAAPHESDRADLLTLLAAAFPFAALTTAAWVSHFEPPSPTAAGYATGATGVGFDLLVLELIRERFGGQIWRERIAPPVDLDRFTRGIWVELPAFGIPAVLALLAVWGTAAPALGTDDAATGHTPHLLEIAALGIGAAVLASLAALLARALPPRGPTKPRLTPQPWSPVFVFAACAAWISTMVWALESPLHLAVPATLASVVTGSLVGEAVFANAARLQLVQPGPAGWVAAGMCALAAGSACFWLLSTGLWAGTGPATAASAGGAAVVALVGSIAVTIPCGIAATRWTHAERLTLNPGSTNMVQDHILYALLALIAAVIPAFAVAHLGATDVKNAGIATIAALTVLPSLLFAYRWVIDTNRGHFEHDRMRVDATRRRAEQAIDDAPGDLPRSRVVALAYHGELQNRISFWFIAAGYAWLLLIAVME
jgi:hypothetical protein